MRRFHPTCAIAALTGALIALLWVPGAAPGAAQSPIAKGITDDPQRNGAWIFPQLKAVGATFLVYDLSWGNTALSQPANPTDPSDPGYNWATLDAIYEAATKNGIRIVPIVYQTPLWANGGNGPNVPPTDPMQYADFLVALAKRYPRIQQWIIWGEPTRSPSWSVQGCDGAQQYAVLLDDAYAALKGVRPSAVVIGGNNQPVGFNDAGSTEALTWLQCMTLPSGQRPRMDMWGLSTYTQRLINMALGPANRWTIDFDDLDTFGAALDRVYPKRHLKFFIFESGTPTGHGNHDWLWYTTQADQAKRMRQMFVAMKKLGRVVAVSNFLLYDQSGADGWTTGLMTVTGQRKPAWAVFRAAM